MSKSVRKIQAIKAPIHRQESANLDSAELLAIQAVLDPGCSVSPAYVMPMKQ
jgi:hypothetical protein